MSGKKKPKYPRGSGISISYLSDRVSPWYVQWRNPQRIRKNRAHATKERAEAHAADLADKFRKLGTAGLGITDQEVRDWRALRALVGDGVSIKEIYEVWDKYGKPRNNLSVKDAIAKFVVAKKAENPDAIAGMQHLVPILDALQFSLGAEKQVAQVLTEDLEKFFSNLPPDVKATYSRQSYHKKTKMFFKWLLNREYINTTPMKGLLMPKLTARDKESKPILSSAECKKLLHANLKIPKGKELVGRLALECFTGMRSSTAGRIDKDAINLNLKVITVDASIDKKGRRYEILETVAEKNVWEWLSFSNPPDWSMSPSEYAKLKSEAFIRAGVKHPHNVIRHTFTTQHVTLYGDAGKTALLLNHHGSIAELKGHYLQSSLGKAETSAYFAILPPNT